MEKIPNIKSLRDFTAQEVKFDSLVKKSIEEGFMTEEELTVGRFVYRFLDLNSPKAEEPPQTEEEMDEEYRLWRSKLPEACKTAAKKFGVDPKKAEELFEKSLDIRSRNL